MTRAAGFFSNSKTGGVGLRPTPFFPKEQCNDKRLEAASSSTTVSLPPFNS
jgi:hypothetical protein